MLREVRTTVVVALDQSGSMAPFRKDAAAKAEQQCSGIPSGDTVIKYEFSTSPRRVASFNRLGRLDGGTALYDTIMEAIGAVNRERTPGLILVITDGEENSSRTPEYAVREAIRTAVATDNFTFGFLVPRGYKANLISRLGIHPEQVTEWEQTHEDLERVMDYTHFSVNNYYAVRAATGRASVDTFFTDMSNVKPTDLQTSLERVACDRWVVDKEQEISAFVQQHGKTYTPGRAFYELTKPELIQAYKALLVKEKNSVIIWGGRNTRNMLGLPYADVKVHPGNHANYSIFVESRSHNRKLVRGTRLLYKK